MLASIVIEGLEFQGACGVTPEERSRRQPIVVDVEMDYAAPAFRETAKSSDLAKGLDYAAVSARITSIGTATEYVLLETLAERLADVLFREFSAVRLSLWVRKLAAPLPDVKGTVGVRLTRHQDEMAGPLAPAPFLREVSGRLPHGRALDVAAGRGRNALYLARLGYAVEAIDRDIAALASLNSEAVVQGILHLAIQAIDLEPPDMPPPELGKEQFDVITVFFYLYRPLFPALITALKPGGMLVYETFLLENHLRFGHPRRREFCLEPNELLRLTESLTLHHYDEGERLQSGALDLGNQPAFTARLLAEKR